MKILFLSQRSTFGGAEVYLNELSNQLEKRGNEIIKCYTSNVPAGYIPKKDEYFIGESFGFRTGLKSADAIKKIIIKENPVLVHIHSVYYTLSPLIIRAIRKIKPVIYTVHDVLGYCFKNPRAERLEDRAKILPKTKSICNKPLGIECIKNRCISLLSGENIFNNLLRYFITLWKFREFRKLDKFIVHSEYIKNELIKNGFPVKKIVLLNMFIPLSDKWEAHEMHECNNNTILYVGSLFRSKGIFELIDVFNLLRDIDWKAKIIGDGYCIDDLKNYLRELNLSERVQFIGKVNRDELGKFYQTASVVVFPSMCPESFGMVGIEAMYFGKPVVAFAAGGVIEWLKNGDTGLLVNFGDINLFAEKLRSILLNKELSKKLGNNAREAAKNYICRDRYVESVINIYSQTINTNNINN